MELPSALLKLAKEHWKEGRLEAALHEAWAAYRLDRTDIAAKEFLTGFLNRNPTLIDPRKRPWNVDTGTKSDLVGLLTDRQVDPDRVATAGWSLLLGDAAWASAKESGKTDALAACLESDELCQTLLREAVVHHREAERELTTVRRWLLTSRQWQGYPRLLAALATQAGLNGGAWPFDEAERTQLEQAGARPVFATYLPAQDAVPNTHGGDVELQPGSRTVAGDYERWPYPAWQRIPVRRSVRLPDAIRSLDPDGPDCIPVRAKILNAGCGTGREAAAIASDYPDATVTAIDISEASLRYARQRCAALGIRNIRFENLDIHDVAGLNDRYDAIISSGVLHHLPDPEKGWAALTSVLRPGGVMKIMLYSKIGYPNIRIEPTLISDLTSRPIDDDVLRQVRQRIMSRSDSAVARSIMQTIDFSTLAGTRDLVLHTEVHLFNMDRIARALDLLGLRLLSFDVPWPDMRGRYGAMFPHDPMRRDLKALAAFEEKEPRTFRGMYGFWCRSAGAARI